MLKELKDTHDEYIRFLAKTNESTVFQTNLDSAFEKLLDFYKLSYEKRYLANSIDLLTDPGEFLKLVAENKKVIQEFLDKKPDINKEVIDKENDDAALKALVNDLFIINLTIDPLDLIELKNYSY